MEKVKIDRIIFTVSILVIITVCTPLVIFPTGGIEVVNKVFNFVTSQFGLV